MWQKFLSPTGFTSSQRTGKWLFDVRRTEADRLFEIVEDAVMAGEIPAAKRASPRLESLLEPGLTILLAYTRDKSPTAVGQALSCLRARGLSSPGRYKDDLSTLMGREAVAYLSSDFEGAGDPDPAWPVSGETVLLDAGECVDLLLTGTDADGVPWGVGFEMSRDTDWEDPGRDGDLLDLAIRTGHRDNLTRVDLRTTARILGRPDWHPAPTRSRGTDPFR